MKLIIGCGKMGGAILKGWLSNGIKDVLALAGNKERAKKITDKYKIKTILSIDELQENPEIILCAIKPYQIDEILPACKKIEKSIFISVIVGKSIENLKNLIGKQHLIIRTMPNISCLVGNGVIGAYGSDGKKSASVDNLLSAMGKVFWLKNENQIEITAALSGGLPAFLMKISDIYAKEVTKITGIDAKEKIVKLFCKKEKMPLIDHILNGWISDAVLLGLENNMAIEMALRTVVGTVELLKLMSPDEVITTVASKKGTTEAGLLAIENGLSPITAAYRRAISI
ncbi:MAG: NAD(P)-binding domain-containing protein [Rickettsiaceae bacterium H1]|nr:NAD(P)-binding domain-containing protein [Rickettsiaceae bacterium H1]